MNEIEVEMSKMFSSFQKSISDTVIKSLDECRSSMDEEIMNLKAGNDETIDQNLMTVTNTQKVLKLNVLTRHTTNRASN